MLIKLLLLLTHNQFLGDEEKKLDEMTMLSVISVFTLHAPPGVMCVQNILYPCINYCTQCFGSDKILVSTTRVALND